LVGGFAHVRDLRGEACVAGAVDDQVAGRHELELRRPRDAEPRTARCRPRTPVSVAGGREWLVADGDAHERRRAGARRAQRRVRRAAQCACERTRQRRIIEVRAPAGIADRERGDAERRRFGDRARRRAADRDRERLIGQLAVELADRGARGAGERDRITRRHDVTDERVDRELAVQRRGAPVPRPHHASSRTGSGRSPNAGRSARAHRRALAPWKGCRDRTRSSQASAMGASIVRSPTQQGGAR
jgi:hypothetical protein